jgi:hypothetical protein
VQNRAIIGAISGFTLIATACSESQFQPGFENDRFAPTIAIVKTAGDTLELEGGIEFGVIASDNLGLKNVSISLTGGYNVNIDTTFTSAVQQVALQVSIELPPTTTAGGHIDIAALATDGNNLTGGAQDSVFLKNEAALSVRVLQPSNGAIASPGLGVPVDIQGAQRTGVAQLGYLVTGVFSDSAGITYGIPLPDTVVFSDTLVVPAGTPDGAFQIIGVAVDSAGRVAQSSPVTVLVQSIANDTDPPIVDFQIRDRVEATDSITVKATDPSGITALAWSATLLDGTPVGGASTALDGSLTAVRETYPLNFAFATLPQTLVVTASATDGNGNTGQARIDTTTTAALRADTVVVVYGVTNPLPSGGRIIDAIYSSSLNEVYLTNIELSRVEVLQLVDTSFASGMPVGSQPWGIALWPRDANGTAGDSVVVANSGGTDLSIVDLRLRREVRRHALPNFLVDEVSTELDAATLVIQIKFVRHDFSDRPQYLGMTCRPGAGPCDPNQILAVYSTTPTIDQDNLPLRGSLRWENLTNPVPESHFFWEHAEVLPSPDVDTLRVIVDRGPSIGSEEILSPACGRLVEMDNLVFRDMTFVRNSGDFSHALAGEGHVPVGEGFAQAVGFSSQSGVSSRICNGDIITGTDTISFTGPEYLDNGISPSFRVSDFISNTATVVTSIALNFNGLTNLVRTTDSVYVLDEGLRLRGLIAAGGENSGMDLNFDHAFAAGVGGTPGTWPVGATGDPDDRLVYLASAQPQIEVYDTYFFEPVAIIPIRDPIIGPLRIAEQPTGEQILVGVTTFGVVTVQLPAVTNPFPTQGVGLPQQR